MYKHLLQQQNQSGASKLVISDQPLGNFALCPLTPPSSTHSVINTQ